MKYFENLLAYLVIIIILIIIISIIIIIIIITIIIIRQGLKSKTCPNFAECAEPKMREHITLFVSVVNWHRLHINNDTIT